MNAVNNTKRLEFDDNCYELCFPEALQIKIERPELNQGMKATKEVLL